VSGAGAQQVSVVVPVRNGERYLTESLDSILGQSTPPGEVLVVDDGSTDATPQLLRAYGDRLRVVRQDAVGLGAALNHGIATARGDVLAFLDADDLFTPTSLESRMVRLDAADRPDAVFGTMVQFVSPELGPEAESRFRYEPGPNRVRLFQTMLIRREAFERVGELDNSYVTGSNIDWMSRAEVAALRTAEVTDVVARRRLHGTNHGLTFREQKRIDLVNVVRAHRRRKSDEEGPQNSA
jgi:glycosyltransferase involved in cell wall biosynthesis